MKIKTMLAALGLVLGVALGLPAAAQEVLPHAPQPFKGKIARTASESTPDFPKPTTAPKGAPNVLLIMTDDVGFAASSTFGGAIPTPTFDKLAKAGLRYNTFHTTALCSPTRSALITGRNHHTNATGVITEMGTGYPGYNSLMPKSSGTVGEILKQNGYNTAWFGKNHNVPDWQSSQAGPFDLWPTALGFERFYGFIGGDTDQWHPALFDGTNPIEAPHDPKYHFDADLADHAIAWIQQQHSLAPDKPFFAYYAPGLTHAPHHAPKEWIAKFKGQFDQGWDKLREETLARQIQQGVVPAGTKLTPRPDAIPSWDSRSADEKKLYAHMMEVYAACLAYVDHNIGRVIKAVEDAGELDNTLIIYIQGDNGASGEGTLQGLANEVGVAANGVPETPALPVVHHGRARRPADLQPLPGGLGARDGHAVPVDQAGRLALRRHAQRPGHLLAQPDQADRRSPLAVQLGHRHRADHPRGGRRQGADDDQRREADADRRLQHGLHLRRREGGHAAQDAVLRAGRQPRHLRRRLDGQHLAAAAALGRRPARPHPARTTSSGSSTTWRRTSRRRTTSPRRTPPSSRSCRRPSTARRKKYNVYPLDASFAERVDVRLRPSLTRGRSTFTYYPGTIRVPEGAAPDTKNKDYTRDRGSRDPRRRGRGRAHHAGRPLRWLGSADRRRQAGVRLCVLQSTAAQVPRGLEREIGRWQAHHQVRIQVRRPGHGQERDGHALGGRQAGGAGQDRAHRSRSASRSTRRSTSARTPARRWSRTTWRRCRSSSPAISRRS